MRTLLLSLALACCVGMSVATAATPVPIEGTLLDEYWDQSGTRHLYTMQGDSSTTVALPWSGDLPNLSPDATQAAYSFLVASSPYPEASDIWVAKLDGSNPVNLTGGAHVGGVNCYPRWSPDGTMIAFQHADPAVGEQRCGKGWQVWIMNADGTNAHQWIASPTFPTQSARWAPDQSRLLAETTDLGCVVGDVAGASVNLLPGVDGRDAEWSRDGSQIAYSQLTAETVGGSPGARWRLLLANADGSNPQVLAQQLLLDSTLQAHIAKYSFQPADADWVGQIRFVVGPRKPKWSPFGDQIAFLAALPFDPNGAEFWYQVEVWLYDLKTAQITRVTTDTNQDDWLSWAGPNTTADHPSVTVDNVTVSFASVSSPGWTSITREEPGASVRPDQIPVGPAFHILTTAQVSGPAVSITYQDAQVPAAAVGHLSMMRFDPEARTWFPVLSTVDAAHHTVTGHPVALGSFALMWPLPESHFTDVSSSQTDPYWALWEIEAAYAAGIVQGYTGGTYQPAGQVTRDQMAVYISRALAGGEVGLANYTPPTTASFPDVPTTYWAYTYVEYAKSRDIVQGYPDGYHPTDPVDRGQMAVYISRSIVDPTGEAGLGAYTPPATASFSDVPTSFWAYKHIEYAKSKGIVSGYSDGTYRPSSVVTRDQMAVYIARAFSLE